MRLYGLLQEHPQSTGDHRAATRAPITGPCCFGEGRQTGLGDLSVGWRYTTGWGGCRGGVAQLCV